MRLKKRRAVAPVIANLLLISIAVVGGTIIYQFSHGFMGHAQISGTPVLEALQYVGYDARDGDTLLAHDGNFLPSGTGGIQDGSKLADERILVYVTNKSPLKTTIAEIRFAGVEYSTNGTATTLDSFDGNSPTQGQYVILVDSAGSILQNDSVAIQPGQTVSVVVDLEHPIKMGRDVQFSLMTTGGNIFVYTVKIGQQVG